MTDKPKNDNKSLLRRNALILSIGLNVILITMLLVLYVPSLIPPPPPTPDAFQLSATAFIATATESARRTSDILNPVPVPTLSPEDEASLRNRFLNELETELGFLHPVLEETIDRLIRSVIQDTPSNNENNYGYSAIPDSIIYDLDRITFEDSEYIAVVIPFWLGWVGGTKGFIFRLNNDSAELLAQASDNIRLESFADRNGNNFPDVALISNCGGSRCEDSMSVYEIRLNNEFVLLTTGLNATINGFVDLENDAIMELYGTQRLFIPESERENNKYPRVPRWFFWNGEAYEALPLIEGE